MVSEDGDIKVIKLDIEMYRHSTFDIHTNYKVTNIAVNQRRQFMYSIGSDRKLWVTCMIGDNKD